MLPAAELARLLALTPAEVSDYDAMLLVRFADARSAWMQRHGLAIRSPGVCEILSRGFDAMNGDDVAPPPRRAPAPDRPLRQDTAALRAFVSEWGHLVGRLR